MNITRNKTLVNHAEIGKDWQNQYVNLRGLKVLCLIKSPPNFQNLSGGKYNFILLSFLNKIEKLQSKTRKMDKEF